MDTPLLSYNLQTLKNNVLFFKELFPDKCSIRYATMANDRIEVLNEVFKNGIGFFVNSVSHLKLLNDSFLTTNGVVFAGSGNTAEDMNYIRSTNSLYFADSLSQLYSYLEMAPEAKVGIRINASSFIDDSLNFLPRIGVHKDEINLIPATLMKNIVAAHVYCGTNAASEKIHITCLEEVSQLFFKNENLLSINISGGFPPIDNPTSRCIAKSISEFWYNSPFYARYHLIIEPGRAIVDNAARFYVKVVDLKQVNAESIAVVNSSYTCYPRKILHRVNELNVTVLGKECQTASVTYHLCGNTTYSNDVLTVCSLPQLAIGDIIVFNYAGAYIENSYIPYLGVKRPSIEINYSQA